MTTFPFDDFISPFGIKGLMREADEAVEFLVLVAEQPGKGSLTRFLQECQRQYVTVRVWHVWNDHLAAWLLRQGYTPTSTQEDGSLIYGFQHTGSSQK